MRESLMAWLHGRGSAANDGSKPMNALLLALPFLLSACASSERTRPPPDPVPGTQRNSPECKALGVPRVQAYPRVPRAALQASQEGWVVIEYDVQSGKVSRPVLVASSPTGLFDQTVLEFAASQAYADTANAAACRQVFVFKISQ